MAIIYTYPVKTNPVGDDLILISDSADSKKTKQVKVSALPSSGGGSVSSVGFSLNSLNAFTLTGDNPVTGSGTITLGTTGGSAGQYLDYQGNWSTPSGGGGGTPSSPTNSVQFNNAGAFGGSANLTFSTDTLTVKDNVVIQGDGTTDAGKLKLNCYDNSHYIELIGPDHGGGASSYSVKFPATGPGGSQKILQSDASGVLSWINTPSSGGGGSVDSVNTTDGTYINLTPNSATTGAVTVTADLSAVDGTSDTNTRFLSKDNTWDVPSYTAAYSLPLATNGARGGIQIGYAQNAKNYPVQLLSEQAYVNVPWTDTAPVDSVSAGTSGASSGNAVTVSPTTGAVKVTSNSYAGTTNVGHVPTGGSNTTFLRGDGTWVVPTNTTSISLTTTGTSGASTWNGTTLNIPQYSGGGSSANLGFTPLSTYEADDLTVASYTYYALLVCDVDVTLSNAKVFVRSGTSAIYAALYSTTSGNMQTSSFTRLGTFSKTTGVATGINILPVDGTVTLTAGQTIMLGFSSANQMAGGAAINSNAMGVETTSLTTSFPASISDIENTTNASKRVAIHFYAG
jgi:hypothetical protein